MVFQQAIEPYELAFEESEVLGYRIQSSFYVQNSYLVVDRRKKSSVVIDPGIGTPKIIEGILQQANAKLDYIFLTHEHYDHIAGVDELRDLFQCQVIASADCSLRIRDIKKNLSAFHCVGGISIRPAEITFNSEVLEVRWNSNVFNLYRTPGHSEGSICISLNNQLFTGDTLIKGVKTVIKLPGGNAKSLEESLDLIFDRFSGKTVLHPGHGEALLLSETNRHIHHSARSNEQ